jgi:hypothetical protein
MAMLGEDTLSLGFHLSLDKDVNDILNSTVATVYPGFKLCLDAKLRG